MADDWQPGDLALCVRDAENLRFVGYLNGPVAPLRRGRIYTVTEVIAHNDRRYADCGSVGLRLEGHPDYCNATRFRKIRPHTPDADDRETIALYTSTPVREPVATLLSVCAAAQLGVGR